MWFPLAALQLCSCVCGGGGGISVGWLLGRSTIHLHILSLVVMVENCLFSKCYTAKIVTHFFPISRYMSTTHNDLSSISSRSHAPGRPAIALMRSDRRQSLNNHDDDGYHHSFPFNLYSIL